MPHFNSISISILSGLAFIYFLYQHLFGNSNAGVQPGITFVIMFCFLYFLIDDLFPSPVSFYVENKTLIKQMILVALCLGVAYTCNALIRQFVYLRKLTAEGDSTIPKILQYAVTALIYLTTAMIIIRLVFNQPIFALAATSGALAVILGYSARSVLEEIFAGIAINFSSTFEKGDYIQINEEWAMIKDIGWRSIAYTDMDNNYVVIPNSVVAASTIRNWERPCKVTRRTLYFLVEYNVPPQVVIDLSRQAITDCPHIMSHEWNDVCLIELQSTGIQYRASIYIADLFDWWLGSNEFFNTLWYLFKREGIRFGQQRHLNYMDNELADRGLPSSMLNDSNWQALIEHFDQIPMFEGITREDMKALARHATLHVFGPPERIIAAGSTRASMYLIASGITDLYEVDKNGQETWMVEITEGETVGLMSLLTGVPQKTTVRARTESAVWEISSESLHALFEHKPELMDNIAKAVVRWQAEETDALNTIKQNRKQKEMLLVNQTTTLYKRIFKFFKNVDRQQ